MTMTENTPPGVRKGMTLLGRVKTLTKIEEYIRGLNPRRFRPSSRKRFFKALKVLVQRLTEEYLLEEQVDPALAKALEVVSRAGYKAIRRRK